MPPRSRGGGWSNNLGMLFLAIWLVLNGLSALLPLGVEGLSALLPLLALAAGVLILLGR